MGASNMTGMSGAGGQANNMAGMQGVGGGLSGNSSQYGGFGDPNQG